MRKVMRNLTSQYETEKWVGVSYTEADGSSCRTGGWTKRKETKRILDSVSTSLFV